MPPHSFINLVEPQALGYQKMGIGRAHVHSARVINGRSLPIVGSLYHSSDCDPLGCHKCVMFLRGNAGTQLNGRFLVPAICPYNVNSRSSIISWIWNVRCFFQYLRMFNPTTRRSNWTQTFACLYTNDIEKDMAACHGYGRFVAAYLRKCTSSSDCSADEPCFVPQG